MKLYEKIALLRKQHGLSQEDLADKLEISRQSVHKWEQGLCYPEIDKIKRLAQIFNVSYDTLLNDDLYITAPKATVLPKAEIPQAPKYRSVFVSQNELDRYHSDYDHGVILNISKRRYKKADELFDERKAEMENVLKSRNYTYVKAPQPDINVRFFVHEKIGICGFYFDGAEQFVLPVENIINASITEKYTLSISYFTSDGKTDIYNISFSIERLYFNYNEVAKSERMGQALKDALAKRTHEALNEIRNKIIFLKAIGEDIKNGVVQVPNLNIAALEKRSVEAKDVVDAYRAKLANEIIGKNFRRTMIIALSITTVVIFAIIWTVVYG